MSRTVINGSSFSYSATYSGGVASPYIYIGNTSYASIMYNGAAISKVYHGPNEIGGAVSGSNSRRISVSNPQFITDNGTSYSNANYDIVFTGCKKDTTNNRIYTYISVNPVNNAYSPYNFKFTISYTASAGNIEIYPGNSTYTMSISGNNGTATACFSRNAINTLQNLVARNTSGSLVRFTDTDFSYTFVKNSYFRIKYINYDEPSLNIYPIISVHVITNIINKICIESLGNLPNVLCSSMTLHFAGNDVNDTDYEGQITFNLRNITGNVPVVDRTSGDTYYAIHLGSAFILDSNNCSISRSGTLPSKVKTMKLIVSVNGFDIFDYLDYSSIYTGIYGSYESDELVIHNIVEIANIINSKGYFKIPTSSGESDRQDIFNFYNSSIIYVALENIPGLNISINRFG